MSTGRRGNTRNNQHSRDQTDNAQRDSFRHTEGPGSSRPGGWGDATESLNHSGDVRSDGPRNSYGRQGPHHDGVPDSLPNNEARRGGLGGRRGNRHAELRGRGGHRGGNEAEAAQRPHPPPGERAAAARGGFPQHDPYRQHGDIHSGSRFDQPCYSGPPPGYGDTPPGYGGPPPGYGHPPHAYRPGAPEGQMELNPGAQAFQPSNLNWQQRQFHQPRERSASHRSRDLRERPGNQRAPRMRQPPSQPSPRGSNSRQQPDSKGNANPPPASQARARSGGGRPQQSGTEEEEEDQLEYPSCVICADVLKVASVGKCNHKEVCAMCSLRMRSCYNQHECPLCRIAMPEVVMTPWRPGGIPDWKVLSNSLAGLWTDFKWQRGVFVDDRPTEGVPRRRQPLSLALQARTGKMCRICDPDGTRLFQSFVALKRHLETAHGKFLCRLCMESNRQFPGELEAFTHAELQAHMAGHPQCQFCSDHLFQEEDMLGHMHAHHFVCQPCLAQGQQTFFANPGAYRAHLRTRHFLCSHPDCQASYVAFIFRQDLAMHMAMEHGEGSSAATGRRRRGRITIELSGPPNQDLPTGPRSRQQREERGAAGERPQQAGRQSAPTEILRGATAALQGLRDPGSRGSYDRVRGAQEDISRLRGIASLASNGQRISELLAVIEARLLSAQREQEHIIAGLRMVDDDVGMLNEGLGHLGEGDLLSSLESNLEGGAGNGGHGGAASVGSSSDFPSLESILAESEAQLRDLALAQSQEEDEFAELQMDPYPSLAAQGPIQIGAQGGMPGSRPPQRARPPRLVSVQRKCACGRRSDRPVVQEGEEPAPLPCNDDCTRAARREQLASAFDIPDPARHRPVVERTRTAVHPPELLLYAHQNTRWVRNVEQVMAAFVESSAKQHNLPPMPRSQRKVVHQMAAAFGLATQSLGVEPNRALRLLKAGQQCLPSNPLSREAEAMSLEQIDSALQQQQGFAMHLIDVQDSNLVPLFRRWAGEFQVEGPTEEGTAVVTFSSAAQLQEALATFGGGLRGAFSIDRRQSQGASALPELSTGPASGPA